MTFLKPGWRVLFILTLTTCCAQQHPNSGSDLFSIQGLETIVQDGKIILSSPLRWQGDEWVDFSAAGLTIVASASLDRTVRKRTINQSPSKFTKDFENFGALYSFGVLAAFEGYDLVANDSTARAVALDGVAASVIASGIVTPVLKYSIGRYRPVQTSQTFRFAPFNGKQSFPSGHATQAFAVATVIAQHYDAWWIKGLAYGTAITVGYSRIQQHAHYLSDVTAGAFIGYFVGRSVVHQNSEHSLAGFSLAPFDDGRTHGLLLNRPF